MIRSVLIHYIPMENSRALASASEVKLCGSVTGGLSCPDLFHLVRFSFVFNDFAFLFVRLSGSHVCVMILLLLLLAVQQ